MITPDNVLQILAIGAGINIILALLIAGQWQEMRLERQNDYQIKQANQFASNYARKHAQMATTSEVIRKGHE